MPINDAKKKERNRVPGRNISYSWQPCSNLCILAREISVVFLHGSVLPGGQRTSSDVAEAVTMWPCLCGESGGAEEEEDGEEEGEKGK